MNVMRPDVTPSTKQFVSTGRELWFTCVYRNYYGSMKIERHHGERDKRPALGCLADRPK